MRLLDERPVIDGGQVKVGDVLALWGGENGRPRLARVLRIDPHPYPPQADPAARIARCDITDITLISWEPFEIVE
ncbi:hypothetical protein [Crenobacter cavernae]|uniref:Uncharacterized protein n=1 Tax=Crenobacter cavernae TaxID=2290923 RepID=A0ABY0FAJ5_9NEIS|nr:hypothetical protein [Crenobacter cavernae]RXZ42672.1 hypothetical protein EBB06_12310 [Crenobacter cavernae]